MTRTVLLGDLINIRSGKARPKERGEFPVYGGNGIFDSAPTPNMNEPAVIVGRVGAYCGSVYIEHEPFWLSDNALGITAKRGADLQYLYYLLGSLNLNNKSVGGAQPLLTQGILNSISATVPNITEQKQVADILGTIDEKIELNRKMNETLEQMGQALFRHYFIDNPEVEKWEKRELGEFFPIKTGKKDANFGTVDGKYPFFTCAQTISKAPDFSFDAHALLLAGNGDFNLKLYRGKFEAYQRTYVLIPKDERLVGLLYFLMQLKLSEITGGSRGSVIKFITKGMIENYKFSLPRDEELVRMADVFNQLTINIEENVKQIQILTTLRDTLLPHLINGKV